MTTELKSKIGLSEDLQLKFDEADKLFQSGDYVQAIDRYKEVIQSNSEYVPALNKLATCCIKIEAEDKAIAIFKRIIEINPNRPMAYAKLAKLLAKKDLYQEAILGYKKAISLNMKQPDWVFIGLGRAMQKMKKNQPTEADQ